MSDNKEVHWRLCAGSCQRLWSRWHISKPRPCLVHRHESEFSFSGANDSSSKEAIERGNQPSNAFACQCQQCYPRTCCALPQSLMGEKMNAEYNTALMVIFTNSNYLITNDQVVLQLSYHNHDAYLRKRDVTNNFRPEPFSISFCRAT